MNQTEQHIVRSTLRQTVREAVVQRVITGRLAPGERVNETTLAQELGVSPTPVREALISLEGCRFLSATPGKGFVVPPLTACEMHEIYSVQAILETTALRHCTPFDAARISRLRELNEAFRALRQDIDAAIKANVRWHVELVSTCPNQYLHELIRAGREAVQRYEYAFLQQVMDTDVSANQHEAVIAALERNLFEEAVELLMLNWRRVIELLRPLLPESASHPGSPTGKT
ncbi:MAG: GntR family transcriptional regulator [Phycisphaerales bacterium]|nr:GntR family transcriptional regulator [Phycisphaerales bacterium]